MNTYEKMYEALFVLCKSRGLKLIEKKVANKKIACSMSYDKIVINKNYHKFTEEKLE